MDWKEKFEIISKKISETLGGSFSNERAAEFLGTSAATYSRWRNSKGVPDANELMLISQKLNLSPYWLLLGIGEPEMTQHKKISTCNIFIADTLRDLIADIERPKDEIAITGGIYPALLNSILERAAELPAEAIQKWIHAYKVNANFLLAQIGKPFLTEEEYLAAGPLDWVRQKRGDGLFKEKENEEETTKKAEQKETDYLRQRILDLERENKALNGQIDTLNKLVAVQAQPLIGEAPFTTERGAALPRSVAPSSPEAINRKKVKP